MRVGAVTENVSDTDIAAVISGEETAAAAVQGAGLVLAGESPQLVQLVQLVLGAAGRRHAGHGRARPGPRQPDTHEGKGAADGHSGLRNILYRYSVSEDVELVVDIDIQISRITSPV